MTWEIVVGDCRESLRAMPARSVQTCVTSPPYFGLRDYGHPGQIGHETTPDEFVRALVEVFRRVRRVLRDDGTVWLNLGDSYTACPGCKPKDLVGIPWMVAFALRRDGWYLRSDIIWAKPNPMPESVTDRPTKAHEYLFLLTQSPQYYYDAAAIREPHAEFLSTTGNPAPRARYGGRMPSEQRGEAHLQPAAQAKIASGDMRGFAPRPEPLDGRNKRSVWTVTTKPYAGAHFATFPPDLVEPCILAGSREGDTVLDPFAGSGTVGVVCGWHGRDFIGCELNEDYAQIARERIALEGRPGGKPNGHEPVRIIDGQLGLEIG